MITIVNNGAIASTQAEAEAYDTTLWPDPCLIFCEDTAVTLKYHSAQTPPLFVLPNALTNKQEALESGVNLKTINAQSLLGSGNLSLSGGAETTPFSATEDITEYKVVTSTGKMASSANTSHRGKVIGIALAAVLTGFVGDAKSFGVVQNPGWTWTIGDKIYLNGTSLSTTAPSTGWSQFIGTATASDTIEIQLGPAILL